MMVHPICPRLLLLMEQAYSGIKDYILSANLSGMNPTGAPDFERSLTLPGGERLMLLLSPSVVAPLLLLPRLPPMVTAKAESQDREATAESQGQEMVLIVSPLVPPRVESVGVFFQQISYLCPSKRRNQWY